MTAEINVVPYIDVMLVLLIIFMVTSPFVTQGVDVELPDASSAKPAQELLDDNNSSFVIVQVNSEGIYGVSFNDEEMEKGLTLQDMMVRVMAHMQNHPNAQVAVGGDIATPYGEVVLLLDELSRAGVPKVGLLTDIRE